MASRVARALGWAAVWVLGAGCEYGARPPRAEPPSMAGLHRRCSPWLPWKACEVGQECVQLEGRAGDGKLATETTYTCEIPCDDARAGAGGCPQPLVCAQPAGRPRKICTAAPPDAGLL